MIVVSSLHLQISSYDCGRVANRSHALLFFHFFFVIIIYCHQALQLFITISRRVRVRVIGLGYIKDLVPPPKSFE